MSRPDGPCSHCDCQYIIIMCWLYTRAEEGCCHPYDGEKKISLDIEIFKNYMPVSNLSFVFKLIERIVCVQLDDHLKENDLYEVCQCACRQPTAVKQSCFECKMIYSKLWILKEEPCILVFIDLSATFDTNDHQKLLDLLNYSFGVRKDALKWVQIISPGYISNCSNWV